MKNFVLLLSSLAIASSAFAASPQVSAHLKKATDNTPELVKMTATQANYGKVLSEKNFVKGAKMVKKVPMKAEGLSVSYEEPEGIFALGLSEELAGLTNFSFRKAPAYTPLTWYNTSVGATEFEWEVIEDFETLEPTIFNTYDLTHSETWSINAAPVLYGVDAAENIDVFQFGNEKISDSELGRPNVNYYYGGDCIMQFSDGSEEELGMTTYMYSQQQTGQFTRFGVMEYNTTGAQGYDPSTGLDDVFTDPEDGYGLENVEFVGYANYFKKPAAPYYISKMWSWMYVQANKATNVEMTLYKVDDDGLVTDEIVAAGEATLDKTLKPAGVVISFELYALDEDGLQTDEPIVIDSAVIAVMKFNKDDIDIVNGISGSGAIFSPENEHNPYQLNAYLVLNIEGQEDFVPSPYSYYTDNTMTQLVAVTDFMWMVDAVFPWTYAVDGVNEVSVPEAGGTASFNIDSYYGIQYFEYYVSDYLNGECDWIDFSTATVEDNEELRCQVLNLPVAPLPEGVAGRSAIIEIVGPASSLKVYVHQGESTGVNVVTVDKNSVYYDLQGRRVANPEKGIYIKKTGNKAEKVLF